MEHMPRAGPGAAEEEFACQDPIQRMRRVPGRERTCRQTASDNNWPSSDREWATIALLNHRGGRNVRAAMTDTVHHIVALFLIVIFPIWDRIETRRLRALSSLHSSS